jgi:hypothetical protein
VRELGVTVQQIAEKDAKLIRGSVAATLFQNLTAGAGLKEIWNVFFRSRARKPLNFADFLLFLHVNGKNPVHIALNQRHPLVFGTVQNVARNGPAWRLVPRGQQIPTS